MRCLQVDPLAHHRRGNPQLARKGMRITWGYYFRIGALLTLPVLLATLSALALRLAI